MLAGGFRLAGTRAIKLQGVGWLVLNIFANTVRNGVELEHIRTRNNVVSSVYHH